ncbi:hypothetical protein SDC9_158068 [bioreactor metagenome]|uniref:Uncharacterized protein n=1 Tax=bioreactor metagenome TaxID=1076179 RepID=A0A645F8Z2_9ZZZZ
MQPLSYCFQIILRSHLYGCDYHEHKQQNSEKLSVFHIVLFYQIYAKILACALNISILHVAKIKTIKNVQKKKKSYPHLF